MDSSLKEIWGLGLKPGGMLGQSFVLPPLDRVQEATGLTREEIETIARQVWTARGGDPEVKIVYSEYIPRDLGTPPTAQKPVLS